MALDHHLTVQRTARYFTIGELNDQTTHVWFCLHGFGQLAQYFSRKFTSLDDGHTLIVVPEGLSRSYLNGQYDRVGASWLTREDKQHEINDFVHYLNTLYTSILGNSDPSVPVRPPLHITLLGFSQGAATACRWLSASLMPIDRLILWAGYFPNGAAELINPARLAGVDTHYVYGHQDEYMVQLDDTEGYLRRLQIDLPQLKLTAYEGGHRVEPTVLTNLIGKQTDKG
ncbi:esterase [Spirosoma knui]